MKTETPPEPPRDCDLCPRLTDYRLDNQRREPTWYNGPAPSFGDPQARLLVLGLAPGRTGANRTGRPFTGDYAGVLLYKPCSNLALRQGRYQARPDDGLRLVDCMVSNAVRCAPPGNRPLREEEAACRPFLQARLAALPRLKAIVTLGDVARRNVLKALGLKGSSAPARAWRAAPSRPLSAVQQLSLFAPEHEHRPADDTHVRGGVR